MSCHPACLLMLHCLLSGCVVNGSMQLPQDRLWLLCEIAHAALHYCDSKHAFPIQTTLCWAWAWMYTRPYCPPSHSLCFFFAMAQPTSRAMNVEFIVVPYMLPFCVHWRYVCHCANEECNLLPHLYWHSRSTHATPITSQSAFKAVQVSHQQHTTISALSVT